MDLQRVVAHDGEGVGYAGEKWVVIVAHGTGETVGWKSSRCDFSPRKKAQELVAEAHADHWDVLLAQGVCRAADRHRVGRVPGAGGENVQVGRGKWGGVGYNAGGDAHGAEDGVGKQMGKGIAVIDDNDVGHVEDLRGRRVA